MIRRTFLLAISGVALWSGLVHAQGALPVIGFLSSGSPLTFAKLVAAFQQGLAEQGFIDGRNVSISYHWAEGHLDKLTELAASLVADRPTVIAATGGMLSAKAAKRATNTIPIVFVIGFDPVELGLVASFNRPGGNVTGTSVFTTELATKRLDLLYDLSRRVQNVAILVNPESASSDIETRNAIAAAESKGQPLAVLKASSETEIDAAFNSAAEQKVGGLLVSADPLFMTRRAKIVALAAAHKMPSVYPFREYVDDGGLMSYGPNLALAYRHSGNYVGRILKGTKPSDLPIDLPTTFELLINLKTAKTLGIDVRAGLLAIADETIE